MKCRLGSLVVRKRAELAKLASTLHFSGHIGGSIGQWLKVSRFNGSIKRRYREPLAADDDDTYYERGYVRLAPVNVSLQQTR